jgi:hypothetical protein
VIRAPGMGADSSEGWRAHVMSSNEVVVNRDCG